MLTQIQKRRRRDNMRDPGGFPRAPLVALATFTAAGGASVHAQMPLPSAATPSGAEFFAQQCAICHSLSPADAPRQGPALAGIYGRKAGSVAGFHYSPGYGEADFVWDEAHLDSYLTDPQALIPGAVMLYKQKNADVRKAIIAFLKEQK
jgi:cytochrome c